MNESNYASLALSCLDLTSLNDNDSESTINDLIDKAFTPYGQVAAICIYSQFVPFAKETLANHGKALKIATVVNFPNGEQSPDEVLKETESALQNGADEIDLVIPYSSFIRGDHIRVIDTVSAAHSVTLGNAPLKVIIESGVLNTESLIRKASEICIDNGADFVKTSTGKVPINATLPAAEYILKTIAESGKAVGFKAAGGIGDTETAGKYIELAKSIMSDNYVTADTFRFGASSLLKNLLLNLSGQSETLPQKGY